MQAYNDKQPAGVPLDPEAAKDIKLFQPITVKSVTFHNRIGVPPMCMYSSEDGALNDFHIMHYGKFALLGAGLVIIEATAVEPQGRITPRDSGLWKDEQIPALKRVVDMIKSQGAVAGLQIAHAGRKASTAPPYMGDYVETEENGGWPDDVRAASDIPFASHYPKPNALTEEGINEIVQKFADTARRADQAGVEVLEIHSAHGYLLHNFLSGNSNKRTDKFGGSLENRMRFPLMVAKAVRQVWPDHKPLWVRFSGSDLKNEGVLTKDPEGWDIDQATEYARQLKAIGVDVMDCSSGGNLSNAVYPKGDLYQVPLAEAIKRDAAVDVAAVGKIVDAHDAESVLRDNKADFCLVGREYLRDSSWALSACQELGAAVRWPKQYSWAVSGTRKAIKKQKEEEMKKEQEMKK
ncbi:uncharacterized protein BYT42DRAFT_550517 [Radiomyces spectabilis]|uniref:uncharacterized protein n=1 Tax=Radiomyces spectabilis TaxID=64574 RepID=UPI00221FAFE6|nr:uncharacterized protein BYT42DRAFT_550517 [Radiomyces spectabilis]KAI8393279.1 hypothetical protein BYT42DRAFT_550517 [Radiomyces spectabilis]